MRRPPALLLLPLLGAVPSVVGSAIRLNDSEPVEYEQVLTEGWRWFVLPTNNTAAVTASLVTMRGLSSDYPWMGFVMMASTSGIPPGSLSVTEYDPETYVHDDPVGPRRQYIFEDEENDRAVTDWKVLTLGIDTNRTDEEREHVQVPLGDVLIGIRCNEENWKGSIPGCRYSLTATLLPFELADNASLAAPMGRGQTHVYRITVGEFDSLKFTLQRDVRNRTQAAKRLEEEGQPANGLVAAAMLGRERWSQPTTLHFPYNLSKAAADVDLSTSSDETVAMIKHQYAQLRADKGLLNLGGCAVGRVGCRYQYLPVATDDSKDPETEKQEKLRSHLWARSLALGQSYTALHAGTLDTHVERMCLGTGEGGTYYLTLFADPDDSGDGRLVAGSDGYHATVADKGPAVVGVDTTGWYDQQTGKHGCWCCTDGKCGECEGVAGIADCGGIVMPPSSLRMVLGYRIEVTHLQFYDGVVGGNSEFMGCVSYGQWRYYEVQTAPVTEGHLYALISSPVGGVYAAAGRQPTLEDHDLVVRPPLDELTLSPCDISRATTWHIGVYLEPEQKARVSETLFTMRLRTSDAAAAAVGGHSYHGSTCCGGIMQWRVTGVPAHLALSVDLTIESGALHAAVLQYDSCARYDPTDPLLSCSGLCSAGFATVWDRITGERHNASQMTHTVPMGETLTSTDKRRAGTWYVGIKALPNLAASYRMKLSLRAPKAKPPRPYCGGHERFCASYTQRYAELPVTTAAERRVPEEVQSSAIRGARSHHSAISPTSALLSTAMATVAILLPRAVAMPMAT